MNIYKQILIDYGATYLRTVSFSYFLTGVSQIYLCIIKNTGKAVTASVISCMSVVINIILNAILIFGLVGFPQMGIVGAAVATVISRIVEVVWCIAKIKKIASGGGIIVGNELGAGNLETAKAYGGKLCRFAVASGCISGLVILALTPLILHIVNLSTVASEYLKIMLYICSYNLIGYAITSTTIAGIFCAGGDTKFGLRCDTVVMWCITVPLGLISAFVLKLPVSFVFFIVNLDELLKVPAAYKHYKKYLWVNDLTAHKKDEELL